MFSFHLPATLLFYLAPSSNWHTLRDKTWRKQSVVIVIFAELLCCESVKSNPYYFRENSRRLFEGNQR